MGAGERLGCTLLSLLWVIMMIWLAVLLVGQAEADVTLEARGAVTVLAGGPNVAGGLSLGLGEVPRDLPLLGGIIGGHTVFIDALQGADGEEGFGGSISTSPADRDTGWRVGAGKLEVWSMYVAFGERLW
jgi:hypothetical protein